MDGEIETEAQADGGEKPAISFWSLSINVDGGNNPRSRCG
ncbi:hypothetical protein GCM10027398_32850 [Azotobacter salinestris]